MSAERLHKRVQVISSAIPNNQPDQHPSESTETSSPHQILCFPPIPLLQGLSETAATAGDINLSG